ncbi:MAG: tyrosine-type recombinase/integrase, partial [Neomegalonema sp.]|nr:tyrosine-type recombinase/integrase [Neomegalonema sp.]
TLGKLDLYTPDEARLVARRHAQAVAEGRDPQREKMERRNQPTLEALFETYLTAESGRLSDRTIVNMRSHMRNQLGPLARYRVEEITRSAVSTRHAALKDTPYAANRAMATLSAIFAFAERHELAKPGSNPVKGLRRYPEKHRERMLDAEEVARLWAALIDLQADAKHRFAAPAIMMGMLTGWRVGEVRTLEWEAVDLVSREATISGKTGARRAPFPKSSHQLLLYLAEASQAHGRGDQKGRWVFPSLAGKTAERAPLADWEHDRTWRAALNVADLEDLRRHDLRHLIAGLIGMQTGSALRVKEAMGHRSVAMSERYIAPISALQRRSTDQAAALVLALAEREAAEAERLSAPGALPSPAASDA